MKKEIFDFINEKYFNQKEVPIFEHFLKPKLLLVDEGIAEVSMVVEKEHLNLHRMIHGGILASIADLTMGIACISYSKSIVTTEMNTTFIKNVTEGKKITAKAKVINNGKSLMRTTCSIYDEEGRLLINSTATYFVLGELEI